MSGMDDDVFTYEVEVTNIPCDSNKDDDSEQRVSHEADDDMGYDPSDVAFTEWLGSKNFKYKTMDNYTKKALWIYWIRGDDSRMKRLMKTYRMLGICYGTKMYHGLMRNHGLTLEFGLNPHQLSIIVSPSIIKLDVRNGQHVVGRMMDTVMEETYLELT
ncbi:hypothetical protein Tco_0853135 [Tanacetum coccineum]